MTRLFAIAAAAAVTAGPAAAATGPFRVLAYGPGQVHEGGRGRPVHRGEPELHRRLLRRISRFVCQSMDRAFGFAFRSAEARLAGFRHFGRWLRVSHSAADNARLAGAAGTAATAEVGCQATAFGQFQQAATVWRPARFLGRLFE